MTTDTALQERAELERKLGELLLQQRDLVERLEQGQTHFKRLARSVWRVQEDERRRLARELHDGLGQNLTAIVNLIDHALIATDPERDQLVKARALAETTLNDTRALSRLLRPQILDDLGLGAALRWLVRTMGENHSLSITLRLADPLPELDTDLSTLIFRVVQEALNNVARHAKARRADVILERRDQFLWLKMEDDGCGCDTSAAITASSEGRSAGLGGMHERVRLFDGEFAIESSPGAGFKIIINVPIHTNTNILPA